MLALDQLPSIDQLRAEKRRRARQSLGSWGRLLGYKPARHHAVLCDRLEAVERGEIPRLMVCMPPGSAKSTWCSVVFPPWFLGRNSRMNIITASYGQRLSRRFGKKCRNIVASQDFRETFGVGLAGDAHAADEWELDSGGEFSATSVGGGVTGRRADCLLAGTEVITNIGPVHIEDLEACPPSVKILSYNETGGYLDYTPLEAVASRQADGFYRITLASGRVVEATGNHPFFANGRYIEAASLAPGDTVLCAVRRDLSANGVRVQQASAARPHEHLLFGNLCGVGDGRENLSAVRSVRGPGRQADAAVLRHVPSAPFRAAESHISQARKALSNLQHRVHGGVARTAAGLRGLLRQVLFGARALAAHVGGGQPEVQGWRYASAGTAALRQGLPFDAPADPGAGRQRLRGLQGDGSTVGSPSYRQLADEQRGVQSGDAVLFLSPEMARGDGWQAVQDTVALVERVHGAATVYDIQVAGNHNFFANGVLVHNCIIIDDPIKGRKEADSLLVRDSTWDWWLSDLRTRLKPGGRIVLINTRWHLDDVSGRLLPPDWDGKSGWVTSRDGERWYVLVVQAEAEEGDVLGRAPGELLWPEWFTPGMLEREKIVQGARNWNALYQQKPTAETGDFFKADWLHYYDALPATHTLRFYGASDYAVTADGGDYTVHVVGALDTGGRLYVADLWRAQADSAAWVEQWCDLVLKWRPLGWAEETGQIKSGVGPFRDQRARQRGAYCATTAFPTRGDKSVRAQSIRGRAALSGLYLPRSATWVPALVSELMSFPSGTHDDQLDALGLLGQLLDKMAPPSANKVAAPARRDAWDKAFRDDGDSSGWKVA